MKAARQKKIVELITNYSIDTQKELARLLSEADYKVTQATISRDIKELGLIKIPAGEQSYRYAAPQESPMGNVTQRLIRLFQDSVISIEDSENLILLRTLPGTANAVASCIDNIEFREIIGTLAGDDTVLVIVKPKSAVSEIKKQFKSMLS